MLGDPKPSDPEQAEPHHKKDQPDLLIDPALRDPNQKDQAADPKLMRQPPHMSTPFVSVTHSSDARLFNVTTFDRHHRTYTTRLPSPPPITTMSSSPSPSLSVDRSSNSTPHIRRTPPNLQQQQPMYPPSYDQRHHYAQRDPIAHPSYSYPPQPFEPQQRYEHHHHPQHPHPQHPDSHSQYHAQPYFSVPTMAHSQPPPPQMRDNYGRQYPPINQAPVTIVHTDDAATKLTDGIRRRCFNCCTTDTSTWRRSNLSPGKVLCNKCGLFERTHSRPRPEQFPHKRGPLAVSVSRGRTPPSNQLPPISNNQPGYQYHHTQLTPLTAGEYHQNSLPGLQTWQNNSSNSSSSNNLNNGTGGQPQNGSNNRCASPPEPQSVSSNGGASTDVLMPRRQPLDSSETATSDSSTSRSGRPFDEPLSSNNTGGSAAVASNSVGGDSSRPHSLPGSPPSRSSTVHPVAVKSRDGGASTGHTTPSPSAIPSAGSSARDQA